MSEAEKAAAKRKREEVAHDASAREFQRRRQNFEAQLDKGRAAKAPPPTTGAPTTDDRRGARRDGSAVAPSGRAAGPRTTPIQQTAFHALLALTPAFRRRQFSVKFHDKTAPR